MKVNIEIIPSIDSERFVTSRHDAENFVATRHYHNKFELIHIETTKGKLFVGTEIIPYNTNSIYLFAPELVHCFKNKIENENAIANIILFDKEFLGNELFNRKESVFIKKMLYSASQGLIFNNVTKSAIDLIKCVVLHKDFNKFIDFLKLLNDLSKHEYSKLNKFEGNSYYHKLNDPHLSLIFKTINEEFNSNDLYKKMLKITKLSSASFSRYFKTNTGKTYTQYINELRISKVQHQLIESNNKIETIAKECGYENVIYFNRVFKNISGFTPKQYRNNYM